MPNIPLTLDEWLPLAIGNLRAIVFNYRKSPYATPRTLDETYLEAVYELARWYNAWEEEGRVQPKWTPSTSATFAWQHALERVHSIFGGVMRTPVSVPRHGPERLKYQSVNMTHGEAFLPAETPTAHEEAELHEMREAILEVLDLLPPQNADAVFLHYIKENSYAETGRLLVIPRETVRHRIIRGIELIREIVGEDWFLHDYENL